MALLLLLQGAHVAEVAAGGVAVIPQHLVAVLRALPVLEVTQRLDQGVSSEDWQLLVVLDVLLAHGHLTLEAHFYSQDFFLWAAVTVHVLVLLLLGKNI